ncbi:MAG: purine-nucleoside phosphorylase [Bacteriovorax sp.]|nr:purine-nucleoside phosphorylase [Bacteriovorax sp.]
MYEKLGKAAQYIQSIKSTKPRVGIVLGSGLGVFVDQIEDKTIIPYNDIPYFKKTTVEGHEGRLILGKIKGVEVAVLQGRLHAYEGLPMEEVVFPVRLLSILGISILILTNAAGGINLNYAPGDLVLIEDHLNLMGKNPLIGPNNNQMGPRFPDMSHAYNVELNEIMKTVSKTLGYNLQVGIYAGVLGPTYETPAEIKMIRTLGGDMVGMSTVPESIAANHLGLKVCGISCITNMGAGIVNQTLKHEDIKEVAFKAMNHFTALLNGSIEKFGKL